MFPRCVTRERQPHAQAQLWQVFQAIGGRWRGIAHVPNGNLRLRDEWAHLDARRRFTIDAAALWHHAPSTLVRQCICGNIMAGIASPSRLPAVRRRVRAGCASRRMHGQHEGTCRIWHEYGGVPQLGGRVMSIAVDDDRMMLKHGAGGRAMRRLIEESFLRAFQTDPVCPAGMIGLAAMDDGAAIRIDDRWLVLTTDSHVIQPPFFPGGDIGRLAVSGTVNDLAMMGATEVLGLTCSGDPRGRFSARVARSDLDVDARRLP